MIGKEILHYKILEKLGEGGMGIVYLAEDNKLKRKVAIKFLPPHITSNSAERKRFEIEAQAAAALNHPNIATIHAIEHSDDNVFIVMEYIEGRELKHVIEKAKGQRADGQSLTAHGLLPADYCLDIAAQIASGLQAAHEKGIIHRDIKSSNIMITNKGQVKIMDFGLAKMGAGIFLTREQSTLGTAPYMSPEQITGDEVDQRSDIWSFGVVFYEMLTGRIPFSGDYEQAVMYSILNEDPTPPGRVRNDIADDISDIVMHTLAKNPEQRIASAVDLLLMLGEVQNTQNKDMPAGTSAIWQIIKKPQILIILLLILIIPTVMYLISFQNWRTQQIRAEMLPQIMQAANNGDYALAYELARTSEDILADDSTYKSLEPLISDNLTVLTTPEAASVYLKSISRDTAGQTRSEQYIGTTPIHNLRVARDDYVVRIEKEDYIPTVRTVSGELDRVNNYMDQMQELHLSVQLHPVDKLPADMVWVTDGRYQLVGAGSPTAQVVALDSFLIDKYEVSNLRFREFILAGGYTNRTYWKHAFVRNENTIAWEDAIKLFTDRSGLPGPRSWVSQEFPAGKGDSPVTGITWYEAAAYAAFAGKDLPTIFEWEKAARNGLSSSSGLVMPWGLARSGTNIERRANFSGKDVMPVSSFEFGISPFGCFNMAGNVKEWCLNQITGGYVASGGSWQDPIYLFGQYSAFNGFHSSNALGFRCVMRPAHITNDQGDFYIDIDEETPVYKPVDEKTFQNFLSHYIYDKKPVETNVINIQETKDWVREKRTFIGPYGDQVIIYLYLPNRVKKPYQCLLYVPSGWVFYGMNVAHEAESTLGTQIKSGRALLTVVLKGSTERDWEPERNQPQTPSVQFREEMVRHATELRMAVDYLESREDIDMQKFAYVGRSWGAGSRLGFSAIDDRFHAVVFIGGGIDERIKPTLPEADNINFAPYIKPPKLMINGIYDEEHNWYTRGLPLYNLLREPKKVVLVEGGHLPSVETRTPVINAWLDETFGPVRFE